MQKDTLANNSSNDYATLVNFTAKLTVFVVAALLIFKIFAAYLTMSASVIASTTDSAMDLISSFVNFLILKFSLRPADHNHNFGHGKGESLAALIQSVMTGIIAISLFIYGIKNVINPNVIHNFSIGVVVTIVTTIATTLLILYQNKIIKITNSEAIKADNLHYKTDVLLNLVVLLALGLSYIGFDYADGFFALLIAIYIFKEAVVIVIRSLNGLLDHVLSQEEIDPIITLLNAQSNILGFHDFKTRQSGHIKFVQFHLELDDNLSLIETHKITDHLELEIMRILPNSEIFIHPEPNQIVIKGCENREIQS